MTKKHLCAQYFCFCLQCAGVSFAACNSFVCRVQFFLQFLSRLQRVIRLLVVCIFFYRFFFVCSVREFCLQCAVLLLAVCIFFYIVFSLQCAGDDFLDVFFMFTRNSFICSVFSLLKRSPLWATVILNLFEAWYNLGHCLQS